MERLAIVIVFYNPTEKMIQKARKLSESFSVFVVDNSMYSVEVGDKINYYSLKVNKGIAEAQNEAIKHVLETDAEYILFLDQDSNITNEDIAQLVNTYNEIEKMDSFLAGVGPNLINMTNNEPYKSVLTRYEKDNVRVDALICSGTLIRSDIIRIVGMMDARLFIDYVDYDWCWRVGSKGRTFYMTQKVKLLHQIGQCTFYIAGLCFIKSSPMRYYFRYRNTLWLCRKSYVPNNWKIKSLLKMPIELFVIQIHPIFKGERFSIFCKAFKGIKDGLFCYEE